MPLIPIGRLEKPGNFVQLGEWSPCIITIIIVCATENITMMLSVCLCTMIVLTMKLSRAVVIVDH